MSDLGSLEHEMCSVCLFDIYRGVFTPADQRVVSSGVYSQTQASAKLSLMVYLLQSMSDEPQKSNLSSKELFGRLIAGMHQEIVKSDQKGTFDEYLGSLEYTKLRAACGIIEEKFLRPDLLRRQSKTYREGDLVFFRHNELQLADEQLQ